MIEEVPFPPVVWATALVDRPSASTPVLARRALGRALALQLLVEIGGGPWTIEADARGKPLVLGPSTRYISIAHTGATIVAAASTIGPIGIDIERHDPERDLNRLALAAFGPAECAAVASHGVLAFYRIWTIREAISKATGDGLALATDGLDRVPTAMVDGAFVAAADDWLVAHQIIRQDLSLALAVQVTLGEARRAAQTCCLASLRTLRVDAWPE
jgi:phosphopantetheinyl transferase